MMVVCMGVLYVGVHDCEMFSGAGGRASSTPRCKSLCEVSNESPKYGT